MYARISVDPFTSEDKRWVAEIYDLNYLSQHQRFADAKDAINRNIPPGQKIEWDLPTRSTLEKWG